MTALAAPRAVVFDLDGTLLDSERAICEAGALAFADIGEDVSGLSIADHLGAPLEELYELFVGDRDGTRRRLFIERYLARHDEHPEANPPPLPGVVDGLAGLRAAGLLLAVATTKPTGRATQQLASAGLLSFFAHVQGTDPPLLPKPAPDVVLMACAALLVGAGEAWMVGDTPRDVGAARAAGAGAILVGYGAERLAAARGMGADVVITSLTELSVLLMTTARRS